MYEKRFFVENLILKKTLNNIIGVIKFHGNVNQIALGTSLKYVFNDFYNISQSCFTPAGIIKNKNITINIEWIKRNNLTLNKIIKALRQFNFDLQNGPLCKVVVITNSPNEVFVVFCFAHIICDAVSGKKVLDAIINFYQDLIKGIQPAITPYYFDQSLPKKKFASSIFEKDRNYWQTFFNNVPPINFFSTQLSLPHECFFQLNKAMALQVKKLAKNFATTPFILLSVIFSIFIHKVMALEHFFVLYPVNMRKYYKMDLAGAHINMIPAHFLFKKVLSFKDLLKTISQQRKETKEHEQFSFDEIARIATAHLNTTPQNIFPFTIGESHVAQKNIYVDKTIIRYKTTYGINFSAIDLLYNIEDQIYCKLYFNNHLFSKAHSKIFTNIFKNIVEKFLANPNQSISSIPLLSEKDNQKIIYDWNQTRLLWKQNKNISSLFEEQAAKTPNIPAVIYQNQKLKYQELNKRANQLARHIKRQYLEITGNQLQPDTLIPILMERSADVIISLLAILKAGAAYVPIDPNAPDKRIQFILKDTSSKIILTQTHLQKKVEKLNQNIKQILVDQNVYHQEITKNLPSQNNIRNLVYVIYTSGTTGNPKGVMIEQLSLINYANNIASHYLSGHKNIDFSSNLSFDLTVTTTLVPLLHGNSIYIYTDTLQNISKYLQHLKANNIELIKTVPLLYELISKKLDNTFSLKEVILGGEKLNRKKLSYPKNINVYDEYGPTETTVGAMICKVYPDKQKGIGKAYRNYTLYILDEYMNPVSIGITGELYIGGMGVARGYLKRPDLTAERFLPNPFATEEEKKGGYNTRIYKTGDLVRWLPDGNIEYIGRADFQVKIRGLRIELGEIEATLLKYPGIQQTVVIVRGEDENKQLVAYYVSNKGEIPSTDLQTFFGQNLPDYMVPAFFVALKEMPLNANGKIDRKALPEINLTQVEAREPLQTLTEAKLAKLWSKVLDLKEVSRDANFFRVGGHSLAAIKLVHEINQTFGTDYAANFVFERKLLHEQAQILDKGKKRKQYQAIVSLNNAAENLAPGQIPLVLVHPGQSGIEIYNKLVANLPAELPIFGVDSYNFHHKKPITSMKKLASYYVKALHQAIPSDTYILGGWSLGGCLAFAMAGQMAASLDRIPLLIMMDSFTTAKIPEEVIQGFFNTVKQARTHQYKKDGLPEAEINKRIALLDVENQMIHRFNPETYPGKTLFINATKTHSYTPLFQVFSSIEPHFLQLKQTLNGWQNYLPRAKNFNIAADHYELTQGEGLNQVSKILNEILGKTPIKTTTLVD